MTDHDVDADLRSRVHSALDRVDPGAAAHQRIENALREEMSTRRLHLPSFGTGRRPLWNLVAAAAVAAVFAGVLTGSLALRHHGSPGGAAFGGGLPTATAAPTGAPTATATAEPSASPSRAATLAPAVVPPAQGVNECSLPLTRSADGNASPLFCGDGGINVPVWNFYASLHTQVMKLGYTATRTEVNTVLCTDRRTGSVTNPEEVNAALLAGRYYGWSFAGQASFQAAVFNC